MSQVQLIRAELLRGPANRITLARAAISSVVAGLVLAGFVSAPGTAARALLVLLAAVALLLDGVDGRVARRTGTASAFGARFDLEVDAFLILVLSLDGARTVGWWVLAIGAARYVFVATGELWPWLRGSVPPRYWCKVVAVFQGVALTVVASQLLPAAANAALLVTALALLAESFGREVWQLWQLEGRPGLVVAADV